MEKLLRNIFRLLTKVSKFFSSLYENYQMYDRKLKSIRDKPNTVKHKLVSLTVDWMTVNWPTLVAIRILYHSVLSLLESRDCLTLLVTEATRDANTVHIFAL